MALLLSFPEHTSPIDSVLGLLYRTNKAAYEARAKASVASFTKLTFAEACTALEKGEGVAPPELVCPLTKALLVDPIKCAANGRVYERRALEDLWKLSSGSYTCPHSGVVLTPKNCSADGATKAKADAVREQWKF